jgi:ABC-2 type transporter
MNIYFFYSIISRSQIYLWWRKTTSIHSVRACHKPVYTFSGRTNEWYAAHINVPVASLILFAAGLDSYNAFNVVDCLVTLARNYNRTVIFTIHQPRSNIVALFDQLILLAQGKLVYSGALAECQAYFEHIGHPCPPGFNIADYLSKFGSAAGV